MCTTCAELRRRAPDGLILLLRQWWFKEKLTLSTGLSYYMPMVETRNNVVFEHQDSDGKIIGVDQKIHVFVKGPMTYSTHSVLLKCSY